MKYTRDIVELIGFGVLMVGLALVYGWPIMLIVGGGLVFLLSLVSRVRKGP